MQNPEDVCTMGITTHEFTSFSVFLSLLSFFFFFLIKKKKLYFLNALAHVSIPFIPASEEDGYRTGLSL